MKHPREYFTILGIIAIIELSYINIFSINYSLELFLFLFLLFAAGLYRAFYIFED